MKIYLKKFVNIVFDIILIILFPLFLIFIMVGKKLLIKKLYKI